MAAAEIIMVEDEPGIREMLRVRPALVGLGIMMPTAESDVVDRIARLRRKIEADPARPTVLKTVHGAGYLFDSHARG